MFSLEKCLFTSSVHFFDWAVFIYLFLLILSCMSCCLFWRLIPFYSHCLQIYSSTQYCLFVYCLICCANAFTFHRSHLFIFVSITLEGRSKVILLQFMSKRFLLLFSSKSFIVSGLAFRSLVHF